VINMPDSLHILWHDDALRHDTGRGVFEQPPSPLIAEHELHPENAIRLRNIRAVLQRAPLADRMQWHPGRHASLDELATFHDRDYIDAIHETIRHAPAWMPNTGSTIVSPGTWAAALAAAGTTLEAVDHVLDGATNLAYALVRPPGHHAQPTRADGYCFFNNAALAALRACARGVDRVAIIDWDVHHGNGTQEGFYHRADVLTISLHMDHRSWGPSHPQDGRPDEIGVGEGVGFNRNIPLPYGSGDQVYAAAMTRLVAPLIDDFGPGLIIVAAGQDASGFDPNGRMLLSMDGFRALGRAARRFADQHTGGRLLLVQEGGYARTYTGLCAYASVEGVLGCDDSPLDDPLGGYPEYPAAGFDALTAIEAAWNAAIAAASRI
jgi:acetoin utilization deacetylase AcuC-like enzyme